MVSPRTINIVTQPSKDGQAIKLALIGFCATIIAALIPAAASLLGAIIVVAAASREKAIECCCIPKDDWKQFARTNGWIPKDECPWESFPITGRDASGKHVNVIVHLLSAEYRWVFASPIEAELGGKGIKLESHIQGLNISSKATVVVAVGMASVEGDFPKQSALAEERTDRLIRLIKDELKPGIPVHGLSLGRYIDETTKSTPRGTASQRRVVVVEVLEPEAGAILSEGVYDALRKAGDAPVPIPFDVRKYKDRNYTDHGFGRP
jgi:hypothetical protein